MVFSGNYGRALLTLSYFQPTPKDSWIQLDRAGQKLYGVALSPFYDPTLGFGYTLRATDSDGLTADASLNLMVLNVTRLSHQFSMTIVTDFTLFTADIHHIIWWMGNLTSYYRSTITDITMTGIKRGSVIISWSNTSITSPYTCPHNEILQVYGQLKNNALDTSVPQYYIQARSISYEGICADYVQLTTTTTTVTSNTTTTVTSTAASTSQAVPGTTLSSTATDPNKLAQYIAIPLCVLLLLAIIAAVLFIVWRRRTKYHGQFRFDEGDIYKPREPVIFDNDDHDGDSMDGPYNELYADEQMRGDDFYIPHKTQPPPAYAIPPSYKGNGVLI